jgi:tetratricopeptide (TPR) repeat protein
VLSERRYASPEFLQRASPYDPVLILENLTALALQAEEDGDVATAMEIFRKLEPLAENSESEMLGNLLNYWGDMCSNHPELGDEGLAVIRKRQAFYKDKNREQWAFAIMDEADYLDLLGRWEEGLKIYEKLTIEMSEFPWVYIRFARFMERGSRFDYAVELYKKVLQMDDLVDSGDLVMIAEELKELAAGRNIELDSETKEEIELLLEN